MSPVCIRGLNWVVGVLVLEIVSGLGYTVCGRVQVIVSNTSCTSRVSVRCYGIHIFLKVTNKALTMK
jgi:hypothetical protein